MISFIAEVLARLMYALCGFYYAKLAAQGAAVDGWQPVLLLMLAIAVATDVLGGWRS